VEHVARMERVEVFTGVWLGGTLSQLPR